MRKMMRNILLKYPLIVLTLEHLPFDSFTFEDNEKKEQASTVSDHSFRVMVNDPQVSTTRDTQEHK